MMSFSIEKYKHIIYLVIAIIIGLAQAAAIMPGISRSGATICAAILLGIRRRWAVEYSFMIAIPIIIGAAGMQIVRNLEQIIAGMPPIHILVAGLIVSAGVGIPALKLLIKVAREARLKYFAFYCYLLALFILTAPQNWF